MQTELQANLSLTLIESSSIYNKVLNQNNSIDGSHIIYLSGASIVFHNIFQNTKTFVDRISDNDVAAMAFYKSSESAVALATKISKPRDKMCKYQVEIYYLNKKSTVFSDINEEFELLDMQFLEKKKVIILGQNQEGKGSVYIVSSHKKIKKFELNEKAFKIIAIQRKMLIIYSKGAKQFDIDCEMVCRQKRFSQLIIKDYTIIENQIEIVVTQEGKMYSFLDDKFVQCVDIKESTSNPKLLFSSIAKVGRNILIGYKNELLISHFIIENNKIVFINDFSYSEKIKAGILSMQVSLDEMSLSLSAQIFHKEGFRIQNFMFNLSCFSNQKRFINPFIRLLPTGVQTGQISSLQKIIPSQVFCLVGQNVIDYSYVENVEKKHKFYIHECPKQLSVHPLGHQILCIFESQIKFYHKVELQIIEVWTESIICTSAKYTESGLLYMSVYEQNINQIIIYDCNCFQRVKVLPIHIKHSIYKIEIDENQTELVLFSWKDLTVYKIKTLEKIAEFKEKKDFQNISCIEYDLYRKWIAVASKNNLTICKKVQEYCLNFSHQRSISFDDQISCIHISEPLQTIFLGTSNGKIIYAPYPLDLIENTDGFQKTFSILYTSIKIHLNPISQILVTNNYRYLFATVKGDGVSIMKIKRSTNIEGKANYNPYDISSYNFIETSSKVYLQGMQEKIKILLQKRKTIFNELEELKKEWENKKQQQNKVITIDNKKKELENINIALDQIEIQKIKQKAFIVQIQNEQRKMKESLQVRQQKFHDTLIKLYEKNDKLNQKKKELENKCKKQYQQIIKSCNENINDIQVELKEKFNVFQENYLRMKSNLFSFEKRLEIEQKQEEQVQKIAYQNVIKELHEKQQQIYQYSNQLKAEITKNKKQLQRFSHRKDFLQNKKRFFVQELKFCKIQKEQLSEVKHMLEQQLQELEDLTHKKQKRLRKYFLQNEILIKYQCIHDNLLKTSNRQIDFLQVQKLKLLQNISKIQKQISDVAETKENHQKLIKDKHDQLSKKKELIKKINQKNHFLLLLIKQITSKIEDTASEQKEEIKIKEFTQIYEKYYIQKKLEEFIQHNDEKTQHNQQINEINKKNQQKIKDILVDHKEYLQKNMNLFQKHNYKVGEEINLNYLRYQTQNYNLIAECNIRKEQTTKKKRILNELIDSVRQTQNYMASIEKENHEGVEHEKPHKKLNQQKNMDIPYVIYEKQIDQQTKEKEDRIQKQKSQCTFWKIKRSGYQVRKMLEVQKLHGQGSTDTISRRIKTAMVKKKAQINSHDQDLADQSMDVINPINQPTQIPKKPLTATYKYRKNHGSSQSIRHFSRNKSNSKPTTCTSNSKTKMSVFI